MPADVFLITGFLGSGKTTFINLLLPVLISKGRTAVIENDFGDIGIDAGLLSSHNVKMRELLSGCICCSLASELSDALLALVQSDDPEYIVVEPSGVSRTSDILRLLHSLAEKKLINIADVITIVDCVNFFDYLEDFGSFFTDQISAASVFILSHESGLPAEHISSVISVLKQINETPVVCRFDMLKSAGPGALADLLFLPPKFEFATGFNRNGNEPLPLFEYWSCRPQSVFTGLQIENIFNVFSSGEAGRILRAKGFCFSGDGVCMHFEYLPRSYNIELIAGKNIEPGISVIGIDLRRDVLKGMFE